MLSDRRAFLRAVALPLSARTQHHYMNGLQNSSSAAAARPPRAAWVALLAVWAAAAAGGVLGIASLVGSHGPAALRDPAGRAPAAPGVPRPRDARAHPDQPGQRPQPRDVQPRHAPARTGRVM